MISAGDGRAVRIVMPMLQIAGGGLILAVSALLLAGGA